MMLIAFWAGGLTAVTLEIWLEWEAGSPYFVVARAAPWRFGVFLALCVLCWPAGLLLKLQLQRRRQREEEAEREEWERVEATRRRAGGGPEIVLCPNCGEQNDVPSASSPLVQRVHWFCTECAEPLDALASYPEKKT